MEVHPDAPANPLYDELKFLLDYERGMPYDYRRGGKLKHMEIDQHNEKIFKDSVLKVQEMCLPTIAQLRNDRNVEQLQQRIYQKWLPHVDSLNICILRSRTAEQANYCFNQYQANFSDKLSPAIKNILLEY